jgi:adhesin transport system outer membrane protein
LFAVMLAFTGLLIQSSGNAASSELVNPEPAPGSLQDKPQEDTRPAIELIGKELILLLGELADAELNPTMKLDLKPVMARALGVTENLPQLKQAREYRLLSEAQRREALSALLPQLTYSYGQGQRDVSMNGLTYSGIGSQQTLTGKQLIYDFGATSGSLSAADSRMEASELKTEIARSEILLRALDAFYETQRALLQVRLSRENLQARRSFVTYIRERAELGASSKADVVRSEARVAEGLDQLAASLQKLALAQAAYRQFYGEEAQPYILPVDPAPEDVDPNQLPELLKKHPQLQEAQLNLDAASKDKESARARLWGGVYFELSRSNTVDPDRPPGYNHSAMFVLRSELYSGGGQQARIAQADARFAQSLYERDRLRLDLERALREAYSDHQGQVAAVSARLLVFRASENTYAIAKELYAFSRSSLFEVFKAQEELFQVGQRLIDSVIDRAKSRFKLMHASHALVKFAQGYTCSDEIECIINSQSPTSAP